MRPDGNRTIDLQIVGLSHVLFFVTYFCAGAGNLSASSLAAGDGWTRSRAVQQATELSCAKADCLLGMGAVKFTEVKVGGWKKDSLRKFQKVAENQCVDSNHSICAVVTDIPKRGKNLCLDGESRFAAHARVKRRTDDLTEPINTKTQTWPGLDSVSHRELCELLSQGIKYLKSPAQSNTNRRGNRHRF